MTAVDRSDEVAAWYAEDEQRERAQHSGQHPDDPGPDEPPEDDDPWRPSVPCVRSVRTEPIPLTRDVDLPPYPADCLPSVIGDMVTAISTATQTDTAMAGTAALGVLAACTGGHVEVEVRPGWREPLCLYVAAVAAPGERKSSVQRSMVAPLLNVERELLERGAAERLETQTRKDVAMQAAERQRKTAAAANSADADEELANAIGAAAIAEAITVPPVVRLVADDVTPEAVGSLMAEQGGRLAVISAEGGVLDIIAGRYSQKLNMDVWLKGHAGDMLKIDRKGRPPEYVPRPALTVSLMIQPSVLDTIAANREFRGRGLLARFLYALPVSKVGHRTIAPPPVPAEVSQAYDICISALADELTKWAGDPAVLTFSEDAQAALQEVEHAVEPHLAPDGELGSLADWGAKYVGAVVRIAGIIHLAEHDPAEGVRAPVTADTIRRAERIGSYYWAAAVNVFAQMGTDAATTEAIYLLDRIHATGQGEVSERDMLRAARRFRSMSDMRPAVQRLVEHGYLEKVEQQGELSEGRPPSPRYRVVGTERTEGAQR